MARANTKKELIYSANENFYKMWELIGNIDSYILEKEFDFSSD